MALAWLLIAFSLFAIAGCMSNPTPYPAHDATFSEEGDTARPEPPGDNDDRTDDAFAGVVEDALDPSAAVPDGGADVEDDVDGDAEGDAEHADDGATEEDDEVRILDDVEDDDVSDGGPRGSPVPAADRVEDR